MTLGPKKRGGHPTPFGGHFDTPAPSRQPPIRGNSAPGQAPWRAESVDGVKVVLADPAVGALEVFRHVLPAGARRNAQLRQSLFLIVDKAADDALPLFQFTAHVISSS